MGYALADSHATIHTQVLSVPMLLDPENLHRIIQALQTPSTTNMGNPPKYALAFRLLHKLPPFLGRYPLLSRALTPELHKQHRIVVHLSGHF